MDDVPDNLADFPEFHFDARDPREAAEDDFYGAMQDAYIDNAPIQVFRDLLEEAPATFSVDRYYCLTHCFITHFSISPDVDVLRLLLEHEPEIAKHENEGSLLLHSAIRSEANFEAIQLILDANPEAVFEKCMYEDGRTPLHLACECHAEPSAETVALFLSRYPGAISISGGPGDNLPILVALAFQLDEHVVLALLDAFPGAASVQGSNPLIEGRHIVLPLHLACSKSYYSFEIVRRLVETYPEGLSSQDSDGNLPLHGFCKRPVVSLDAVKFLLEKNPDAISTRNDFGQLPLHCALLEREAPLPVEIIEYLIESYPESVNTASNSGNLPLHMACYAGVSRDALRLLLDRYTGEEINHCGLSVANNTGWLPLHCYAGSHYGTDTDALQHLLDLYPQGMYVADTNGRLPLHVACAGRLFQPSLNIIRPLVEADLYTVVKTCQHGTPYQIAYRRELTNVDVQAYLFEKQNEAVAALKEACEHVGATQLGLPDLVVAQIWSFVKPDLWLPDNA